MAKRMPPAQLRARMAEAAELREQNWTQREIAAKFGVSQPTVHYWLHKLDGGTLQEKTAARIREQLVCCDIYDQVAAVRGDLEEMQKLRESNAYHDICFYGEWAARLAEGMKD